MTEYREVPPTTLPVDENGWHRCSNCGDMWWATRVTLGRHGDVGALHVSDTVCAACGFPLIEEDAPVL